MGKFTAAMKAGLLINLSSTPGEFLAVITDEAPSLPAMFSTFAIIIIHRLPAWIGINNYTAGNIIREEKKVLCRSEKALMLMKKVLANEEILHWRTRRTRNFY